MDPFDLASLFALRELIEGLDRSAPPVLRSITPMNHPREVALLPGSFNPPTAAHTLLAERAMREGFDTVVFTLARTTVGKKQTGLIPEDRLLALRMTCERPLVVAACSHGLYADQAEAAASAFPGANITFLVGSDKVIQIFEDRWYENKHLALERLFSRARLLVAPRANQAEHLKHILQSNRVWSDRVDVMRLHPAVSDLSSTRVRGLLRSGAEPSGLVPSAVAELLMKVRAFAPPVLVGSEEVDAYDVRARLLDMLWTERGHEGANVDLRALVRTAVAPGEPGRMLRAMLTTGRIHDGELARAQAAAG
jgi:nicotinic acid mononucleotide adenylyltransferase